MNKDYLLRYLAHETRTPIQAIWMTIHNMSRQLEKFDCLSYEQKQKFNESLERVTALTQVLNQNISNVNILSNDNLTDLRREVIDVREVIKSIIKIYKPSIEHSLSTSFEVEGKSFEIKYPRAPIYHVYYNLYSNAVKYSLKNSTIKIKILEEKEFITTSFENYSNEIAIENQDKLFDLYYRADINSYKAGAGIGLFVTKQLVEKYGGNIAIENLNNPFVISTKFAKTI